MIKIDDLRTAHIEGHTFVAYGDNFKSYITAGAEGDIRSYPDLFDDETVSITGGSKITCMVAKGKRVVLANDLHEVKSYSLPDLNLESVLLRFTGSVNHICISKDGTRIGAASSDFSVKIVNSDGSEQKTFTGHEAPVYSLCISGDNMVSCSCDGSFRVWDLSTQKCIKALGILPIYNSPLDHIYVISMTTGKNKCVAVPFERTIKVISASDWTEEFILPTEHSDNVCIVKFSPCAKYVCSATNNGEIFAWDIALRKCVKKYQQHLGKGISSLQWNEVDEETVLFADVDGEIGLCTIPKSRGQLEDFDDDDNLGDILLNDEALEQENDEIFVSASAKKTKKRIREVDEDDISTAAKKKHRLNNADSFLNDEAEDDDDVDDTNISLNLIKEGLLADPKKPVIDEDNDSLSSFIVDKPKPKVEDNTFCQKAFQPSSTPIHLMHRFMVWNDVGIIRCHSEDDMSSIDVEFHDSKTSHSLHIPNAMNNTMAALSSTVVIFACEKQENMPSKLMCTHFASWDSNREWSLPMQDGENIECISANRSHVVIATSNRLLRILSVGGIQTQLMSLPGPIVSMAMHDKQLVAVYQKAAGLKSCQSFGILHLRLIKNTWKISSHESMSLRSRVSLTWLGFSTEGTPVMVDSSGDVLLLQRSTNSWLPIANTKKQTKSKSDNYWVVAIEERSTQIRCIYCKGANFPATLPRPVPTVISFQIPLCELTTEKSMKEHDLLKSQLVASNISMNCRLFHSDIDDDVTEFEKQQIHLLMQLFALACKSDRDYRAVEICNLMPLQAVGLAIQYATKMRRMGIAKRLTSLAQTKAAALEKDENSEVDEEEEEQEDDGEQNEDDVTEFSEGEDEVAENVDFNKENEKNRRSTTAVISVKKNSLDGGGRQSISKKTNEEELFKKLDRKNSTNENEFKSSASSQGGGNPFKVGSQKNNSVRGTNYFETLESQKLQKVRSAQKTTEKKQRKKKTITIPLINKKANKIVSKNTVEEESVMPALKKLSGFQLFMKEQTENKSEDEENVVQIVMSQWKQLSFEEKKIWNEKGSCSRDTLKNNNDNVVVQPASKSKLSSFAYNKSES